MVKQSLGIAWYPRFLVGDRQTSTLVARFRYGLPKCPALMHTVCNGA